MLAEFKRQVLLGLAAFLELNFTRRDQHRESAKFGLIKFDAMC